MPVRRPNHEKLNANEKARTSRVKRRIEIALNKIASEIEEHEGVYPYGRLTVAEICRRANVSQITLYGENHRHTTLVRVKTWLAYAKKATIAGRKCVRRALTERVSTLRESLSRVAAECAVAHASMVDMKGELKARQEECHDLRGALASADAAVAALSKDLDILRQENQEIRAQLAKR